jgi:hypothetical protein
MEHLMKNYVDADPFVCKRKILPSQIKLIEELVSRTQARVTNNVLMQTEASGDQKAKRPARSSDSYATVSRAVKHREQNI